jgi:hypothetical protein
VIAVFACYGGLWKRPCHLAELQVRECIADVQVRGGDRVRKEVERENRRARGNRVEEKASDENARIF